MATTVTLRSSEGDMFEVDHEVAMKSIMLANMIEDVGTENPIPLCNVSSNTLSRVIEYCKYHVDNAKVTEAVNAWDAEFVKLEHSALFELILAANYMNIPCLMNLTCFTVANKIKGKTPEQIRATFNIENDFSPEEEEEVRKENQWAFE